MNESSFNCFMQTEKAERMIDSVCAMMKKSFESGDELEAQKALGMAMLVAFEEGFDAKMVVDVDVDLYESMSISQLAIEIKRLKQNVDDFNKAKVGWQKAYDYLTISVVPDRMDEDDIGTIKINNVGRLQLGSDIRCSVPSDKKEDLKDWLKENGHGSMISDTINSSTLKAFVREMMKENKPYPKDLLKIEPYSRATVVKA